MNKLECVAVDLDGSLLSKKNQIHPQDLATIRRLKEKGVLVFANTGRHFSFARPVVDQIGFDLPAICSNGAHIYDYRTGETLMEEPMPPALAADLQKYLTQAGIDHIIYTGQVIYYKNSDNPRIHYWRRETEHLAPENRIALKAIEEDFDITGHQIHKIMFLEDDREVVQKLKNEFEQGDSVSFTSSYRGLYDINLAKTSKGNGLSWLARKYGFDLKNTLALGDEHNDIPVLSVVGYPVVPQNGEDAVKAAARFVTSHCDEASLTDAIRHFFPELL